MFIILKRKIKANILLQFNIFLILNLYVKYDFSINYFIIQIFIMQETIYVIK